jgi:hypothetical protein
MKELVFETAEQRKKKAAEPVPTPEEIVEEPKPAYTREETVVGTDGDVLTLKYLSPTSFEVWKDGKLQRTFV